MKNSQAIDLALRIVALHEVAAPADIIIAAARERERCAQAAEKCGAAWPRMTIEGIAAAIRALA